MRKVEITSRMIRECGTAGQDIFCFNDCCTQCWTSCAAYRTMIDDGEEISCGCKGRQIAYCQAGKFVIGVF
jgi:hypothetical protein